MKCPHCGFSDSRVVDSRPAENGESIRRRRECEQCRKRFTTFEVVETLPVVVIKKDGSRQTFDRAKVFNGMLRACEKRPVSFDMLKQITEEIEQSLQSKFEREIPSSRVGELVMERLREMDEVAYIRFASVYRQFEDINTFLEELNKLQQEKDIPQAGSPVR